MSQARPPATQDAERFDPPVTRVEWRTPERQRFGAVLETLATHLDAASVARLLRHRGLQIDGRPVGEDDVPDEIAPGTRVVAWALAREPEPIAIGAEHLLRDEDGIVAATKPAWLPVQGTRASQCFSLEEALRSLLGCPELRAVHRLDRETSGVVLLARDARTASRLGRAFAAGSIHRRYLAVVSPSPAQAFEVEGRLRRVLDPQRFRFALASGAEEGGKPSHTRFRRLEVREGRALVEASPTTGRTHQIRVHLAAAGSPIVGDRVYGGPDERGAPRCLLHAQRLSLALPGAGETVLEAPLPDDFVAAGFGGPAS